MDSKIYTVEPELLDQFDQRQTIFGRRIWDTTAAFYQRSPKENLENIIGRHRHRPGYSRLDYARSAAARTVHDRFIDECSWKKIDKCDVITERLGKHLITDVAGISQQIKDTARMYGASLVGICEVNPKWVYSYDISGNVVQIPSEFKYAVVIVIKMDAEAIQSSPTFLASTVTEVGYLRMAFTISCLAGFIHNLGYQAMPMGNDTALSIPLAIDAELGGLGRNGLLITRRYGPCVRICKVFTDMPLKPDKPKNIHVEEVCKNCKECADACEAKAIQTRTETSFEIACPSNNIGIKRWAVNHDRCYEFWIENGTSCSTCIAVCPYTKRGINLGATRTTKT
ncbi:Epoxyqueuosine reductase [subsurface metagenome]